jgi:hypothetical protein
MTPDTSKFSYFIKVSQTSGRCRHHQPTNGLNFQIRIQDGRDHLHNSTEHRRPVPPFTNRCQIRMFRLHSIVYNDPARTSHRSQFLPIPAHPVSDTSQHCFSTPWCLTPCIESINHTLVSDTTSTPHGTPVCGCVIEGVQICKNKCCSGINRFQEAGFRQYPDQVLGWRTVILRPDAFRYDGLAISTIGLLMKKP